METIALDLGLRSYRLGNGILRFHPGDPNLYARFLEAVDKLKEIEQELVAGSEGENADVLLLMTRADRKMKEVLNWIFGAENDFGKLLGDVNLLAEAENGERVVTNLFAALEPVLADGARNCAAFLTKQAKENRA